ncbi:MAG: hypothetical protein JSV45_10255 [Chromatiales bacterium]|nr:MAG: hypothetical protein JSV45_10255 [Chromatiales bacterium]
MIAARVLVPGIALAIAGCAGMHESPDFERHSASQLSVPYERDDVVYFDVKLSPTYPDGDAAAEQKRMEWLQAWLDFKGLCPNGYEIVERRKFRFEELNAGRYDLRYEVACTPGAANS